MKLQNSFREFISIFKKLDIFNKSTISVFSFWNGIGGGISMNSLNIYKSSIFFFLCLFFLGSFTVFILNVSAQERSLGEVNFANSCDPKTHETLNSSVALIHHMMYQQAEKEFQKVAEIDSACPMAYWGITMTLFHPLWAPPSKEELAKGYTAIKKAKELKPNTLREMHFVSAVESFYDQWDSKDHNTRIAAWSEGQKELHETYPNDVDAAAYYALSLLATAPKKDKEFKNQQKAGEVLENMMIVAPEHPGLSHYTIHAYDNPKLAKKALNVARGYDSIAPKVPHALHMPSHIFVRLGIWPDTIDWNIRSAAAAEEQSTDIMSLHYIHAVDYLIYAHLQQGQYDKAEKLIEKVNSIQKYQDSFASAYGIAAAQSRSSLEQKKWNEAANLTVRTHSDFPWDKHPQYEAITYYTKGLGAARSGDLDSAKKYKTVLDDLYKKTLDNGENYWSVIVDAQRKTVDAWITYAGGDKKSGIAKMQVAADLETSVDKHPVTPGSVMPALDVLGDMLLLSDKPADALLAYESSLGISPNRYYSISGAKTASEKSGLDEKAEEYSKQLDGLVSNTE